MKRSIFPLWILQDIILSSNQPSPNSTAVVPEMLFYVVSDPPAAGCVVTGRLWALAASAHLA